MQTIILTIIIFTDILTYIIFADVILSWLTLVWVNIRPKFISSILDPIYDKIKQHIPVSFWPFLFTPLVLLIFLYFVKLLIFMADPSIKIHYYQILNF